MSFRRPDFYIGALPRDAAERTELARQHRIIPPDAVGRYGGELGLDVKNEIKSSSNTLENDTAPKSMLFIIQTNMFGGPQIPP